MTGDEEPTSGVVKRLIAVNISDTSSAFSKASSSSTV